MKKTQTQIIKTTSELSELAIRFQEASMSISSRACYRSDWRNFLEFCDSRKLTALPASSDTICLFLAELGNIGRATTTIIRSLTSIAKAHEIAGFPSVRDPLVKATMKGIKRQLGVPKRKVKGLSYSEIKRMADLCDQSLIGARDKAVLLLGWCSAMRRSELVALNIGDLDFIEHGVICTIRRSKTDQDGAGAKIAIPYSPQKPCPVESLQNWIGRLDPSERGFDKPLFRSIGSGGQRFWYTKVRGRLESRTITLTVKKYARLLGMPPEKYASHSLRRGLATEAGARRIPERIIARHTRHVSMEVLREYIEAGNIWDDNPLKTIFGPLSTPPETLPGID